MTSSIDGWKSMMEKVGGQGEMVHRNSAFDLYTCGEQTGTLNRLFWIERVPVYAIEKPH